MNTQVVKPEVLPERLVLAWRSLSSEQRHPVVDFVVPDEFWTGENDPLGAS